MCTARLPVVLWTDLPPPPGGDLNGIIRFAERRNLVSAHVPSHFKRSLVRDTRVCHNVPCAGFEADVGGSNEEGEDWRWQFLSTVSSSSIWLYVGPGFVPIYEGTVKYCQCLWILVRMISLPYLDFVLVKENFWLYVFYYRLWLADIFIGTAGCFMHQQM